MTDIEVPAAEPLPSALLAAHIVYGLHAFAIAIAILGTATIIGSFVGSIPSIIAVIISYVKRGDARGSWAASHFRWQIRTFWFALLWVIIAVLLVLTVIGMPFGIAILLVLTLWLLYRVTRGWLRLADRQAMYVA